MYLIISFYCSMLLKMTQNNNLYAENELNEPPTHCDDQKVHNPINEIIIHEMKGGQNKGTPKPNVTSQYRTLNTYSKNRRLTNLDFLCKRKV